MTQNLAAPGNEPARTGNAQSGNVLRFKSNRPAGNTFIPFMLDPQRYKDMSITDVVKDLLERLAIFTETRRDYYDELRAQSTNWVFRSRGLLAIGGALALFSTTVAAALQLAPDRPWAQVALTTALIIYAAMGAIVFYNRATDVANSYFRHVAAILSIRDLWTKLEFEVLKEIEKIRKAAEPQVAESLARDQVFALAQAYCSDLDKLTTVEMTEWRTAFVSSLSELDETAKKGSEDVAKRLQDYVKAAEKAAADAKAAAEAKGPGQLNLTIEGIFEGEVTILVDAQEQMRSAGRSIGLKDIPSGNRIVMAKATAGGKPLETSKVVEIRPGIQTLGLKLEA